MSAFTEANRKAFNDLSDTYNSKPWQREISNQVAEALHARKDWLGVQWSDTEPSRPPRDVRLLDYACGTGAITRALGPFVNTIRGIDISENMVEKYNEAAVSSGLTKEQAHAVVGDLCGQTVSDDMHRADLQSFDIAVIGLGFHHFEDPELAMKRLAERLNPGTGVLVIVDFLPFDDHKHGSHGQKGDFPEMNHTIKHNGFTGNQMRELYQKTGFEDFDIVALSKPAVMQLTNGTFERTMFIAKGRRTGTAWQRFTTWIGGAQDAIAGQVAYGNDPQPWNQGLGQDEKWNAGLRKDNSTWSGMGQQA